MPIPFVRKLPNGKRKLEQIQRSPVIENLAGAFLRRGGRYLLEVRDDGLCHLMAILGLERDGVKGVEEVAHVACKNGPDLPISVDTLVQQSIDNSPAPPQAKIIPIRKPELILPAS